MTTTRLPAGPITDRDRRRACRQAHVFGAAAVTAVALLLFVVTRFRAHQVPVPVLIAVGSAVALAAGLAADLTARPPRVLLRGGWLAVSRLGRWQRVDTARLAGLSANPRVAGSVVLTDEHGNLADIDVRVLVRNPLIWQQVCLGVSHARQHGSLHLHEEDALLWDRVGRMVAEADRQALTRIDFWLPR
jgi:MFS family permease